MRCDVVRFFRLAAFLDNEIAINVPGAEIPSGSFSRFGAQFQTVEKLTEIEAVELDGVALSHHATELLGQVRVG